MGHFTPVSASIGGVLIGLSDAMLCLLPGRPKIPTMPLASPRNL